jgi:hypothetical protein
VISDIDFKTREIRAVRFVWIWQWLPRLRHLVEIVDDCSGSEAAKQLLSQRPSGCDETTWLWGEEKSDDNKPIDQVKATCTESDELYCAAVGQVL